MLTAFKVNVMGTSAEPKVRLILKTTPELSFPAKNDGEQWTSTLELPSTILPGDYDIQVEVILNNRLFTPVTKKVAIDWPAPKDAPISVATIPDEINFAKTEDPEIALPPAVKSGFIKSFENKSDVSYKKEQLQKDFINIFKSQPTNKVSETKNSSTIKADVKLTKLAETVAKPVQKAKPPVVKPIVKTEPIKIKISEVDAVTSKTETKIVESHAKVKPETKKHVGSPIKLIKENLIYE